MQNKVTGKVLDGHFPQFNRYNKGNGGGSMNNDYVTHKEFDDAMNRIDRHFDKIDAHFEILENKVDSSFKNLENEIKSMNRVMWWIMSIIAGGVILPIIAFAFHAIFF